MLAIVEALGMVRSDRTRSIPVLTNSLRRSELATGALWALGQFEGEAKPAIPAIIPYLSESLNDRDCWASAAVWRILPPTKAAELVPISRLEYLSRRSEPAGAQILYLLRKTTESGSSNRPN
jgi:hypothetical protein